MTDTRRKVYAAIMAAGCSTRFGSTKQLADICGVPLVRRIATTARQVCRHEVVTVVGHDASRVLAVLGDESGFVVVNDAYDSGLGTSICRAVRTCQAIADAILILLADQPLVTSNHLQALIAQWSGDPDEIVASSYAGTDGPPVLFASGAFEALCSLEGDKGAHALLSDSRFSVSSVPFEPASVDIDTPGDLAALR